MILKGNKHSPWYLEAFHPEASRKRSKALSRECTCTFRSGVLRSCGDFVSYRCSKGSVVSKNSGPPQIHWYKMIYFCRNGKIWKIFLHIGSPMLCVDTVSQFNDLFYQGSLQNVFENCGVGSARRCSTVEWILCVSNNLEWWTSSGVLKHTILELGELY